MLAEIPNLQDAYVGTEIVLHMKKDQPLDAAKLRAVLAQHKQKLDGEPVKDASYIL